MDSHVERGDTLKGIDTGKEKVKQICDILRRETLEPAKKNAEQIVHSAQTEAAQILYDAKVEAEKVRAKALEDMAKEKSVFQASLNQACKQSLESLKDSIENKLFDEELSLLLKKPLQEPRVIADLIQAVISALQKEGIDADLDVIIPRTITAEAINELLLSQIVDRLNNRSVSVGSIQGGIEVKIQKEHLTIDVTDTALKEMVSKYIRKDFREILFRTV